MKAGKSSATVTVLSSLWANALGGLEGLILGRDAAHQFDQLHHRYGVHEMDTDEAFRPVSLRGKPGDRDRRCVGGKDRGWVQHRAKLLVDLALDRFVLGCGLHDEVGAGKVFHGRRSRNPGDRGLTVLLLDLAVAHRARQIAAHRRHAILDALGRDVIEQHPVSGERRDMGNPAAHLPGAHDANGFDCSGHHTDPIQGLLAAQNLLQCNVERPG